MIIEIETKNGALAQTVETTAEHVPRVGEEIHLAQDGGYLQGCTRLMVIEVTYRLADNVLTAFIRCRPTPGQGDNIESARRLLLEELGWHPAQRD